MPAKPTFDKKDYTAIHAKQGGIIDESTVDWLKNNAKLDVSETRIYRNGDDFAVTVYVKTSKLKREIPKDRYLCGLLETGECTLSDIVSEAKRFRLSGTGTLRSERISAQRYIDKTKKNESTFAKPQQSRESDWPDRIKRYGPLATVVGLTATGALLAGRILNATTGVGDKMAEDIVTATDIDYSGNTQDGLDRVTKKRSGIKEPEKTHAETEEARRDQENEGQRTP